VSVRTEGLMLTLFLCLLVSMFGMQFFDCVPFTLLSRICVWNNSATLSCHNFHGAYFEWSCASTTFLIDMMPVKW
jgi:hypothetical protein